MADEHSNEEAQFLRDLGSLDGLFSFVQNFTARNKLGPELEYTLNLVAEELFTNMVKYSPDGDAQIQMRLAISTGRVVLTLVDSGVEPFDPRSTQPRDIDRPTSERRPGGLGVHLVKELVDEFQYDYRDGCSTITVAKRLE
jgi:anti-sigma regulatory factor (Ser/Thr protein kinase)